MSGAMSRRDLLAVFFRRQRPVPPKQTSSVPAVAVIQGRFCLAYRNLSCSVCIERCPVPGAIVVERGIPRVNAALCNGCNICHELCPAPTNAILMLAKKL